jgi:fatty acid synthase
MKTVVDIGAQLPSLTVGPISPETVTQFSLAQRDFNPIHVSTAAAQAAGFSGPIVHGVFIIGQFERLIRSWEAMDIVSLQGRFLRPVSVGAVLVLSGRVLQKMDDALSLRLLAKDDDGSLVAIGEAKVRLTSS